MPTNITIAHFQPGVDLKSIYWSGAGGNFVKLPAWLKIYQNDFQFYIFMYLYILTEK